MKRSVLLMAILAIGMLSGVTLAQETNLTDGCVTDYDPAVDYFPQKAEITHADGLEIEYFNNYKIVRTLIPFPGAEEAAEYVLVQCGTPAPQGYDDAFMVEVPVQRTIALSTTVLPHLKALEQLDSLVAVDSFLYIVTPEVRQMIDAGDLVEVGFGASINVEVVLDVDPDVVFAYGYDPTTDANPVLEAAGIFTAINSEWLETSPLGRAEWIKFTGAFYNEEAAAAVAFDEIVSEYERLSDLAAGIPEDERPVVLPNAFSSYSEAWDIPGTDGFLAQLYADAGVRYVLQDAPEVQGIVGNAPFAFEAVYDAGLDADYWVIVGGAFGVQSLDDLLALDERYADFAPVGNDMVYNIDGRVNENGGNDYYESGVTNPHLILADLIHIFHPELLPDHELIFHKHLQ